MATVTLNAATKAYPLISNRIRASVYLQTDPQALIATIIDTTPGHPARTFSFPGLERANYGFSLDEIDGAGDPVNNLALFDVVPSTTFEYTSRDDEQIQVGSVGIVAGATSFTFDGTSGTPDYRGWNIVPSELNGRGIMIRGTDYSWNTVTGTFTLLQSGDAFQTNQWYNIHFDSILNTSGNSVSSTNDFQIVLLTTSTVLDSTYFGKKLIIEPSSDYIEITLPDLAVVPAGRKMMIEVGGSSLRCVKFLTQLGQIINFPCDNLYALTNESFSIYKLKRVDLSSEYRIDDLNGNFKTVGNSVASDLVQSSIINAQLLDGSAVDKSKYARIYNEIVLNLPVSQVVNYDLWETGNNKYFFSLANSANPLNANKFRFPDRRGVYEKNNTLTGKAGDYQQWVMPDHQHEQTTGLLPTSLFGRGVFSRLRALYEGTTGTGVTDLTGNPVKQDGSYFSNSGLEAEVNNYLINKYILL